MKLNRRSFGAIATGAGLGASKGFAGSAAEYLPGIWSKRFGAPKHLTPVSRRKYAPAHAALAALPTVTDSPLPLQNITGQLSTRGFHVQLPLAAGEMIYGLGLQLQSVLQRGRKKTLRVNADPVADSGDSHAPVPFYVSNRGYGILIDTARYLTIYCGNKVRLNSPHSVTSE